MKKYYRTKPHVNEQLGQNKTENIRFRKYTRMYEVIYEKHKSDESDEVEQYEDSLQGHAQQVQKENFEATLLN